MTNKKTLILIDGHALAYRSFFALERTGMKTSKGQNTWAVFGFLKALFDILKNKDLKPDSIAVSFDVGRKTFRTEAYPEYKANRQSMPDSLGSQIELIIEGLKTLKIPIYTKEGFEADDVIGTISHKAKDLGHKTYILTGDQDSFQLVDDESLITILIPSKGEIVEYDKQKIFEKMGVYPNQVIDYKGLRGDTSDNIPGIRGVGEKTAVKLLSEFKTLDNVLENIEKVSGKSLKEKLETGKEIAKMSQYLATIDLNVDIDFDFEHTHIELPDLEKVAEFFRKVEFNAFLKNIGVILRAFNNGEVIEVDESLTTLKKSIPVAQLPNRKGQLSLFGGAPQAQEEKVQEKPTQVQISDEYNQKTIIKEEDLKAFINKIKETKVFALDTETAGLNPFEDELVGISIAYNHEIAVENNKFILTNQAQQVECAYIPVGHIEGEQLDKQVVVDILQEVMEDKNIGKIFQNAKFDISVLENAGVETKGPMFDTMLASYVVDPADRHGLKNQALRHLQFDMKNIEELIGKGKNAITMDKVKIDDCSNYACDDAYATYELAKYYIDLFDEKEAELFYTIEIPLVKVLGSIEKNGVAIDSKYLAELSREIQSNLSIIEAKIYQEAGCTFNINSPKQVGDVLFETMQIPHQGKTKTKTGYSTSAKVLENLAKKFPIAKLLLEQRHLAKIKSTYIDSLPLLVSKKDGRIHTSFNQAATTTGRLSSSDPNLQNIPIRTEIGSRIRAAFVPEDKENSIILSADYSQIELRLLAHVAQDENLIEAFTNGIDIHSATASKVFGVSLEEVTKDMRRKAKAVNFGIIYGQTSYGLSESIGVSPGEAKEFIDKYFETYPKIKEYMDNTKEFVKENGFVETIYGRRRHFKDELANSNRMIREFALRAAINAPLQGAASDIIKLAMIEFHKKLNESNLSAKVILQVHDELVLELPKTELEQVGQLLKEAMELGQPLKVPLDIDIQYGPSWMESETEVLSL